MKSANSTWFVSSVGCDEDVNAGEGACKLVAEGFSRSLSEVAGFLNAVGKSGSGSCGAGVTGRELQIEVVLDLMDVGRESGRDVVGIKGISSVSGGGDFILEMEDCMYG